MAANLKMKKKCHIVPPYWLNVGGQTNLNILTHLFWFISEEWLQEISTEETSENAFSKKLPFRYIEVAKVLLDVYVPITIYFLAWLQRMFRATQRTR